jgi:NAD+ synthase (glutamine-hydrolysing)
MFFYATDNLNAITNMEMPMRLAIAQLNPTVGDLKGNTDRIIASIDQAQEKECRFILFSELALCGYPPEDLLFEPGFIEDMQHSLMRIVDHSKGIAVVVGLVRKDKNRLYNSAAVIDEGQLIGFYDKHLLPTYDVFDESRYFEPGTESSLWNIAGKWIGITICEDIWQHSNLLSETDYCRDPVQMLKSQPPLDLLFNLSASPYSLKKLKTRLEVVKKTAASLKCPVALCNQVGGNDSLLFDGHSCLVNSEGQLIYISKGFSEDMIIVDLDCQALPIIPPSHAINSLYDSLVMGVRDYFHKTGHRRACLGLSGGIDSALVACIAADALGAENVLAIGMPSRFSSKESLTDSEELVKNLGIAFRQISIESPFSAFLHLLQEPLQIGDLGMTAENLQARIRGMLLMAHSNQLGYLLLNTGNKSELAMGYCTLYGDMCGALSVLGDVTKTNIYALARCINQEKEVIPWNIIEKAPSAELRPNQKDTDSLPDYAVLDAILEAYIEEGLHPEEISAKLGHPTEFILAIVSKIYLNEYKRRQTPPILRVTEKALTPSAGRKVPIAQRWKPTSFKK